MRCNECGKEVLKDDVFCRNCGVKLTNTTSNITINESRANRIYTGKSAFLNEAADLVKQTLKDDNLQTNFIEKTNQIIVQGQKSSSTIEKAIGLDKSVTVILSVVGEDLIVQVGGAKWMDKAAGAAIGLLFWPSFITAGWGAINQTLIMDKVDNALLKFLR